MRDSISAREAMRSHWPEYLIEAWALGAACAQPPIRFIATVPVPSCIHCGYAP
jgi:hypothetical protein